MQKRLLRISLMASGAISLSAVLSTGAFAQAESENSTTNDAGPARIEDILVTAQRRVSNVQTTPIAVSAFGGDALKSKQIVNIESLASSIPNVQFGRIAANARIFIRGIGLDTLSQGADGRVALYTDGVYNARPQAALASFYDIERVEVLRGPQGTLYGRNATAGAVNILSRHPGDQLNGYGTLTIGNYSLIRTEGAIGGPISDTVSARFAFQTADRDGYGRNIQTDLPVDDERTRAVRAKVKFQLSPDFTLLLTGDYRRQNDHNGGYRPIRATPNNVRPSEAYGVFPASPRDAAGTLGPRSLQEGFGLSGEASLEIGDTKLVSITAFRHLDQQIASSVDGNTASLQDLIYDEDSDQFSQELRIERDFGRLRMLVGAYYFHELDFARTRSPIAGILVGFPPPPGAKLQGFDLGGKLTTDAYAAFAQGTLQITDQLGIDVGGRYSYERRSADEFFALDLTRPFDINNGRPAGFISPRERTTTLSQKASWSSFDPKVTVHYKFDDQIYGYLTYSRGFKSGGINLGGLQTPFKPERLTDYEVGLKADFFDRRLRTNLSAFFYDYRNLQVNKAEGLTLVTRNAAKARLYGIEAEITALPVDELQIKLNGGWLHSEYLEYSDILDIAQPRVVRDLAGNQLPYAPEFKVDGEIGYTFRTDIGDITPRVNASWTSRVHFSPFNLDYNSQPARTELNLYLDYAAGAGWTASAFMRNATNVLYQVAGAFASATSGYGVLGLVAPPRTFGLTLTKRFGAE